MFLLSLEKNGKDLGEKRNFFTDGYVCITRVLGEVKLTELQRSTKTGEHGFKWEDTWSQHYSVYQM